MAHRVLVNSKFTKSIFRETFTTLRDIDPQVVYPAVDVKAFLRTNQLALPFTNNPPQMITFVSVNRFERKKKIELAVDAFALVLQRLEHEAPELSRRVQLVIAGGYDPQVLENVEYLEFLQRRCAALKLREESVVFKPDVPFKLLVQYMHEARSVVYTPDREHLGIVPLEAMGAGVPVIAVASGGPLETVLHNETGFLVQPEPAAFAEAMVTLTLKPELAQKMGERGLTHVRRFDRRRMGDELDQIVHDLVQ
eukprot:c13610_g1_i1.p1 GENE.c13610_g1_i1~~c13610_g1_i1.p1  ORF type:complete len:252 (+),score=48.73 c13610_g1_i1:521-1276(+)